MYKRQPEVDEFKVKVIPDNAAKILALRNGEIDAILGSSRLSAEGYTAVSYTHLDVYKRQIQAQYVLQPRFPD